MDFLFCFGCGVCCLPLTNWDDLDAWTRVDAQRTREVGRGDWATACRLGVFGAVTATRFVGVRALADVGVVDVGVVAPARL